MLLVSRPPPPPGLPAKGQPATVPANPAEGDEPLSAVWDDGSVTALHGHVDLGTGIRTALAQIVAEELDAPLDAVNMILGSTAITPNQGATIASASIQVHAWLAAQPGASVRDRLAGRHVERAVAAPAQCVGNDRGARSRRDRHRRNTAGLAAAIAAGSANVYTAATIEKGRLIAAAGNCVVCHTAPGGVPNAGGRALETPFGIVYSTNLTPDPTHGIGSWSLGAFQRAMREGISRDGQHLYPAFPYNAFTQMTDDDLTGLYAYLMAQLPTSQAPPETKLAFPFGVRRLDGGMGCAVPRARPGRSCRGPIGRVDAWRLTSSTASVTAAHATRRAMRSAQQRVALTT